MEVLKVKIHFERTESARKRGLAKHDENNYLIFDFLTRIRLVDYEKVLNEFLEVRETISPFLHKDVESIVLEYVRLM